MQIGDYVYVPHRQLFGFIVARLPGGDFRWKVRSRDTRVIKVFHVRYAWLTHYGSIVKGMWPSET